MYLDDDDIMVIRKNLPSLAIDAKNSRQQFFFEEKFRNDKKAA